MAIKVLKRDSGEGCNCMTEYLCDTSADAVNLPTDECAVGSIAIVVEPDANAKRILILNTNGEWK